MATATEVSIIGIVYPVIAGLLIYRQFEWRRLLRGVRGGPRESG